MDHGSRKDVMFDGKNRPFGGFGDLIVLTYTELGNDYGSRCKAQEPIRWGEKIASVSPNQAVNLGEWLEW